MIDPQKTYRSRPIPRDLKIEAHLLRIIVDTKSGCWIWQGPRQRPRNRAKRYGFLSNEVRRPVGAHRWFYERMVGPIPTGLEPDHLCRDPWCVNPSHLEMVTHIVNTHRGSWYRKTHCVNGHPRIPENLTRRRQCRICIYALKRARRAANPEKYRAKDRAYVARRRLAEDKTRLLPSK